MGKRLKRFLIPLMLSAMPLLTDGAAAYARSWEALKTERADTRQVIKETDVEIRTTRGTIIVTASRPVQIKVFTILGQLISSETLPAGTSQLQVGAHGVYIIKTGEITCKVAL